MSGMIFINDSSRESAMRSLSTFDQPVIPAPLKQEDPDCSFDNSSDERSWQRNRPCERTASQDSPERGHAGRRFHSTFSASPYAYQSRSPIRPGRRPTLADAGHGICGDGRVFSESRAENTAAGRCRRCQYISFLPNTKVTAQIGTCRASRHKGFSSSSTVPVM